MIDVPTLLAVLSVDCLVIAATVFATRVGRMQHGQASWVAALLTQSAAMWLFVLMAMSPPGTVLIVASIVLLSASMSLFAASMAAFAERPLPRLLLWLPPILLGIQHTIYADDFITRAQVSNAVVAFQLALCAWPLSRAASNGPARYRWMVAGSFLLGSVSTLLRLAELLVAPERLPDLSVGEPINAMSFLLNHVNLIVGNLGIALMHRERSRANAERLVARDALTELFNRRSFTQQAARELLRAERGAQPVSVLVIDPDHFRQINARFGALAGDRVLRQLAQEISAALRGQDLCARLSADEFAVLLPDTALDGAEVLAERLRTQCGAQPVGPDLVHFTVSIGVAGALPGERDPAPLLARAQHALALAKQAGRNCVARAEASA
ncbi:diguanylate cyclase [Niveibacterium sp.]|uniref:GGDEF domain-containing protein n=1 Tax=Niveibacterium sp. TaxID=2017444 RepID=UPI0035B0BFE9